MFKSKEDIAKSLGYQAYIDSILPELTQGTTNPYIVNTEQYNKWEDGYVLACKDWQKIKFVFFFIVSSILLLYINFIIKTCN
jgi:hypothetical protein